ncbi:hypothetical protein BSP239C_03173 [Brevibacterium sp. 239c]|uniref:hypothetical protein n=1 Tax=Brevibacterium sp. 239c TaxID=1965356 RepID=UPI000C6AD813|nr:hypothetical protein [Brevibacterium sp. 239c]SMY01043.1 hypothetical protein BSP239C_03173 [Brevibacterium sp. 239c]
MADATPESNLALIEELQELVSAEYAVPEGPEYSYPAVGQAVDDEMWKFITLALGSGILDDGGWPYWLRKLGTDSETNQANQMKLTVATTTETAQAVLQGFYHRLLKDMRLDFPMPLSDTTYYVVLELNPLKARDPEGPISVKVYPNELNTESGREHLLLWTVGRKPNQLLTDATITRYRPRVAPTITVTRVGDLPDPATVLYGTVAVVYDEKDIVIARGANNAEGGATRWESLNDPEVVYIRPDSGVYQWVGHGAKPGAVKIGQVVYLEGRLKRAGKYEGQNFNAGTEYNVMNLPAELRPKSERRFLVKNSGLNAEHTSTVTIYQDGRVVVTPGYANAWIPFDGCTYTLTR